MKYTANKIIYNFAILTAAKVAIDSGNILPAFNPHDTLLL